LAKKKTLLEQMRGNPRADWTIDDISKLCAEQGIELVPPSTGSHYKAWSPHVPGRLTIPAARPIKPVYIKLLISMIDAHNKKKAHGSSQGRS
jgi:hypothetical protein